MPWITFTCHACGQTAPIDATLAGQIATCPLCGRSSPVPSTSAPLSPPILSAAPPPLPPTAAPAPTVLPPWTPPKYSPAPPLAAPIPLAPGAVLEAPWLADDGIKERQQERDRRRFRRNVARFVLGIVALLTMARLLMMLQ